MISVHAWGGRIAAINVVHIPISLKRSLDLTTRIEASRNDCLQILVSSLNGIIRLWLKSEE